MKCTPIKFRDDTWGVKVVPPSELQKGAVITVDTRKGTYKAIVQNLVFSAEANDQGPACEAYAVKRLPDVQEGYCPMCGSQITQLSPKQEDERTDRIDRSKARRDPPAEAAKTGNGEDFDDDIPF